MDVKNRWVNAVVWPTFFLTLLLTLGLSMPSFAGMTLATTDEDVMVYSGPGEQFRVLAVLPVKSEVKASNKIVSSKAGRFYRVIVNLSETIKAAGFIPVNAPVKIGGEDIDEDELSKYGAVALISKAGQVSYAIFKDRQSLLTIGYMHYLSPGFYVKGFGGQWTAADTSATVGGAEIGNDALLVGNVSAYVSYGMGVATPSDPDVLFAGAQSMNLFMSGGFGLRYNFEGFASFAAGLSEAAIFNQNNSLVTTGFQISMEISL